MSRPLIPVGSCRLGGPEPLYILGPCVIESEDFVWHMAKQLKAIAGEVGVQFVFKASYDKANRTSVKSFRGLGVREGCQILASIEFSRRFLTARKKIKIRTPKDALPVLAALRSAKQECVVVLTLDGNNQVIRAHTITRGLANQSQIHPRETFHPAISDHAVSILVAHNHPSGNLEPSESDLIATRRLVEVSRTLGIRVVDHLIVAESGFLSIREKYPAYFG